MSRANTQQRLCGKKKKHFADVLWAERGTTWAESGSGSTGIQLTHLEEHLQRSSHSSIMRPAEAQAAACASLAVIFLALLTPTNAFVAHHGPAARLAVARTTLQSGGKVVAVPPPRSALAGSPCRASRSSRNAAGLSMAFDLGEVMEQMKSSMMGGGGGSSGGSGGGANGKHVVYDAAIVGYGPAGGVMVSEWDGRFAASLRSYPGVDRGGSKNVVCVPWFIWNEG